MVLPALRQGNYHYHRQVYIGQRPGGGRHIVDVLAWNDRGDTFLISLKWQQVSGTAEQKVPFEVICLAEAVRQGPTRYNGIVCEECESSVPEASAGAASEGPPSLKAYLVLGGAGWKLRHFFTGGGLSAHLTFAALVAIVTLEDFVARANRGQL